MVRASRLDAVESRALGELPGDRSEYRSAYRILHHGFRVHTNVPRLGALARRFLGRFAVPDDVAIGGPTYELLGPPLVDGFQIHRDRVWVETTFTPGGVVDRLLWEVYQEPLRSTERFVAVHAGAVSLHGTGVILPAPMDSGKTTLTTGLVRAGFRYLSDEAALIEPGTGRVHPFAKSLTLEGPTLELMPELIGKLPREYAWPRRLRYHLRPEDVRPRSRGTACAVGYVIAPRYEHGARTELVAMGRPEALVMLAENSFNLDRLGGSGVEGLAEVVRGADCYRLTVGDLESSVKVVLDLLHSEPLPIPMHRRPRGA